MYEMAGTRASRVPPSYVDDHVRHPRNVGSLAPEDPNVGTGLVEAPDHGDVTKLQVKVNRSTGVIDEARFKAWGCSFAIASASLATEWITGRTVDAAQSLTDADLAEALSLSPTKAYCSTLAEAAVKAAVADYRRKQAG